MFIHTHSIGCNCSGVAVEVLIRKDDAFLPIWYIRTGDVDKESGTISLTIYRDDIEPGQNALVAAFVSKALTTFRVVLPLLTGQTIKDMLTFTGVVKSLDTSNPPGQMSVQICDLTLI